MDVAQRATGDYTSNQYALMRRNVDMGMPTYYNLGIMDYALKFVNLADPIVYGRQWPAQSGFFRRATSASGAALGAITAAEYMSGKAISTWHFLQHKNKPAEQVYEETVAHPGRIMLGVSGMLAMAVGMMGLEIASTVKLLQIGEIGFGAALIASIVINAPVKIHGHSVLELLRLPNRQRELYESEVNEKTKEFAVKFPAFKH